MNSQHETRPNDTRRSETDRTPQTPLLEDAPEPSASRAGETPPEASRSEEDRGEGLADCSHGDTMNDTESNPYDHIQPKACPYCGEKHPNNQLPHHIATCDERPPSGVDQ